jgi:hypothetical protein
VAANALRGLVGLSASRMSAMPPFMAKNVKTSASRRSLVAATVGVSGMDLVSASACSNQLHVTPASPPSSAPNAKRIAVGTRPVVDMVDVQEMDRASVATVSKGMRATIVMPTNTAQTAICSACGPLHAVVMAAALMTVDVSARAPLLVHPVLRVSMVLLERIVRLSAMRMFIVAHVGAAGSMDSVSVMIDSPVKIAKYVATVMAWDPVKARNCAPGIPRAMGMDAAEYNLAMSM